MGNRACQVKDLGSGLSVPRSTLRERRAGQELEGTSVRTAGPLVPEWLKGFVGVAVRSDSQQREGLWKPSWGLEARAFVVQGSWGLEGKPADVSVSKN